MKSPLFAHTRKLSRFIIRRDRIRIPLWLVSLPTVTMATAMAFTSLYPTAAERQILAETMINPATTAIVGPGYGLDHYTFGAMMAHQMLGITALMVGMMSILIVVRHTRADEESGRIELIRSLPIGRLSHLAATLLVVCGAHAVLAGMTGLGLYVLNIESMDLEGSLLYGAALGAIGFFFTAITAFLAQLSESSRGTMGLSFAVLGLSYLIRAVGDVSNQTLSWFSPFGWIMGTEVYVHNYWWPIFLTVGMAFVIVTAALYLHTKRDLMSGFLPSKPGRKHASPLLRNPFGLVFRLQRTGFIAWGVGLFIVGATYGSVLGDTESFFEDIDMMQELLRPVEGVSLTEQFLTMLMAIIAMISTIPALMVMMKLKKEEAGNRTELIFSLAVSRTRLMSSYFILSFVSAFIMLSIAVLGMAVAATTAADTGIPFSTFMKAAWVYLPAMWIMVGMAVFAVGVVPKWANLIWMYLVYSYVVIYLGGLFQFPDWMGKVSPFGHIPKYPVEDTAFATFAILTAIALVLIVGGYIGYKKRDIQG